MSKVETFWATSWPEWRHVSFYTAFQKSSGGRHDRGMNIITTILQELSKRYGAQYSRFIISKSVSELFLVHYKLRCHRGRFILTSEKLIKIYVTITMLPHLGASTNILSLNTQNNLPVGVLSFRFYRWKHWALKNELSLLRPHRQLPHSLD